MNFITLSEDQLRQFIDAEATFTALEQARHNAKTVRGSMFWRSDKGKDYLVRATTQAKQERLGVRSAQTEEIYQRFTARKAEAEARVTSLEAALVDSGENMLGAVRFSRMIVAVNGAMARITTIAPDAFVKLKRKLSRSASRDPLKREKDGLQALVVQKLIDGYMINMRAKPG